MFSEIPLRDNNDELFKNILDHIKEFIDAHHRRPSFLSDDLFERNLGHLIIIYRNYFRRRANGWRDGGERLRIWRRIFGSIAMLE
jgi:hypothetical protein